MKTIPKFFAAILLLLFVTGCAKKADNTQSSYEFSIDAYTNPTDQTQLHITFEDGRQITYSGTKDASGMPVKVQNVVVNYPDDPGDYIIQMDDNMMPKSQMTPNGTEFEYQWLGDSVLRIHAISPGGEVQITIPVNLKTLGTFAKTGNTEKSGNVREGVPSKPSFREYMPYESKPLKPVDDNRMIFHVRKCGTDVIGANVILHVDPALGGSTFPCTDIGNGFYSAGIPKRGQTPSNYEQECDKIGNIVNEVCSNYDMLSLLGSGVTGAICTLMSDEIAKAFPGSASGDKIKAMCSNAVGALKTICEFNKKTNLGDLCKLAHLLYFEPKQQQYQFWVDVAGNGIAPYTSSKGSFDPDNPQTYMVDMSGSFDLSSLYSNPADPAPLQGYTAYADVTCPDPGGTPVTISVVGTDGYSNSFTQSFTANGQISLYVPGGGASVSDHITVTGSGKTITLTIVF